MSTRKSIKWTRLTALLVMMGFTPLTVAAVQVDLDVSGSKLTVTANTAQCEGGPIDCIDVKYGTNPHLYFNLKKACKSGGPAYKLAGFRIGMQHKTWPSPSNPLPAHVAADFNANPLTGYVDLENSDNKLEDDRMKLKDHNRTAYTVYYDVIAAHCSNMSAADIHLDPQIKNGGNN